jgi:NhaP-type Na+/H+ or K+/H+ antiporter
MNAPSDNTAPKGLRGWWASPPRSGMRRIIVPFEYRHLRAWAGVRTAIAIVLVGLAAVTLSFGGNHGVTYGWTAFWLVLAAVQFTVACWFLAIARSVNNHPEHAQ